jgi:hypothetical protein
MQTLRKASMKMLAKIETLEKQAVLTTTSVREDIHCITKLNTEHTDELSLKLFTHLHLSDLRTKAAAGARQELGSKVEKLAQQVSDSIGQQDTLLPLLREMTETAAKREQEHQQQLDQIQEQWSESVKEIHRGHTMLQAATVCRQDELSAQVLALVQAISTLTVSVEDMATHRVQEQLLQPAARAIEARKPDENEMLVQTSGEQLHVDHRPSMSDLEAGE